jgi:hypothetical protein
MPFAHLVAKPRCGGRYILIIPDVGGEIVIEGRFLLSQNGYTQCKQENDAKEGQFHVIVQKNQSCGMRPIAEMSNKPWYFRNGGKGFIPDFLP